MQDGNGERKKTKTNMHASNAVYQLRNFPTIFSHDADVLPESVLLRLGPSVYKDRQKTYTMPENMHSTTNKYPNVIFRASICTQG